MDGTPATDAIIFHQRVVDLERTGYIREQEILAAAMAHEIGHLLLGSNSHSRAGIMRAKWNRDELELARLGRLLFTEEESAFIRGELLVRMGSAAHRNLQTQQRQMDFSSTGDGRESEPSSAKQITDSGLRAMAGCS